MARLIKITGAGTENVDRLASSLVKLGNTSAATEGDILSFALDLASRNKNFNVSALSAIGLATAFKEMGSRSESASSSVSRGLGIISASIDQGGRRMKLLSRLTGLTGKQFREKFTKDSVGTLLLLSNSMKKVTGGDSIKLSSLLSQLGLKAELTKQTFSLLTKEMGRFQDKIDAAKESFEDNLALNKEYEIQMASLTNKFKILRNRLDAVFKVMVLKIQPTLEKVMDAFSGLFGFLERNPALAGIIAKVTLLVVALGSLLLVLGLVVGAFAFMASGLSFLGVILGAVAIAIKVIVAIAVVGFALMTTALAPFILFFGAALAVIWAVKAAFSKFRVEIRAFANAILDMFEGMNLFDILTAPFAGAIQLAKGLFSILSRIVGIGGVNIPTEESLNPAEKRLLAREQEAAVRQGAAQQSNFTGNLNISGLPQGSSFDSTTKGMPPLNVGLSMAGAN
jgi:TP901 family phage tail tape measure protein